LPFPKLMILVVKDNIEDYKYLSNSY
jgi:hypothetical protein